MPSSYTPLLRLVLPVTGELTGSWGNTVNVGLTALIEASIAGTAAVAMTDADRTLTTANEATDEARQAIISLTGTLTAARNVICPTSSKIYIVRNATTGGFPITFKTLAGTGISVPAGAVRFLRCDGTNVVEAITGFTGPLTAGTAVGQSDLTTLAQLQAVANIVPLQTTGFAVGTVFSTAAGVTILTGLTAGSNAGIYNDSAATITLTQGAGLTLRFVGSSQTGNRTLAQRGLANVYAVSTTEYIISGGGLL